MAERYSLTPKSAINRLAALHKRSERMSADGATKYQIRLMFNYIESMMQYQVIMPPTVEESGRFICPRCQQGMIAESGTVDDYAFCPLCGQRWKGEGQ